MFLDFAFEDMVEEAMNERRRGVWWASAPFLLYSVSHPVLALSSQHQVLSQMFMVVIVLICVQHNMNLRIFLNYNLLLLSILGSHFVYLLHIISPL